MVMLQRVMRSSIESALDRLARVLDHAAGAALGADLADQRQREVFGSDERRRDAVETHPHGLGLAGAQRLGGQHMLHLRGADAVGEGAERAVGAGVGVSADDGHPRLGAPLFRPDHVDDAVARIGHGEELDPRVGDVAAERLELKAGLRIGDAGEAERLPLGRHIVIGDREGAIRPSHRAARRAQSRERLGRGHFMDEVQVDVEDGVAARLLRHQVRIPDLVVQRLTGHGTH